MPTTNVRSPPAVFSPTCPALSRLVTEMKVSTVKIMSPAEKCESQFITPMKGSTFTIPWKLSSRRSSVRSSSTAATGFV